ncbi:hypothetical protein ACGF0J_03565 [Nonomuraea sp. NPDC047897]|uniref:hypothetical protein n=1 Tax=Nonomuraea sp. NPDC047897 TaxID=3364346 RepID=UPI003710BEAB
MRAGCATPSGPRRAPPDSATATFTAVIAVALADVITVALAGGAPAGRRVRREGVRPFVRMPPAFARTRGHVTPPEP